MKQAREERPRLTTKEEEIMRVFWDNGPLFVKDVIPHLPEPRPHINTVSTVVRVREKKGYIGHEKMGGSFRYHAILEKDSFRKSTLIEMLKNYFDNNLKNLVSALVEEKQLTEEEIKDCIDIIENKK